MEKHLQNADPEVPATCDSREPDRALEQHVLEGLTRPRKHLSSQYLYDEEGSRIFQQIMALPEYYLTRIEDALLHRYRAEILETFAPRDVAFDLLEPGCGDGSKTLTLCETLAAGADCVYQPMDISAHALQALAQGFHDRMPTLAVQPWCGNYFEAWPERRAGRRRLVLFMGSNLGNFTMPESVNFLQRIRSQLLPGDALLLGLDRVKDPGTILAAYDDSQGVTAEFNFNLLRRLNRELGMDFDLARFSHCATYCPVEGTARSFLVSRCVQQVRSRALDTTFHFGAWEAIQTEQSQKYRTDDILSLASSSGFEVEASWTDAAEAYALVLMRTVATDRKPQNGSQRSGL